MPGAPCAGITTPCVGGARPAPRRPGRPGTDAEVGSPGGGGRSECATKKPADGGEEDGDHVGVDAHGGNVAGQQLLGRRPALQHDRGRPPDHVEDRGPDGGVGPVHEDDAVGGEEHVVRAHVAVHERGTLARRRPARLQLGQPVQVRARPLVEPRRGRVHRGQLRPAAEDVARRSRPAGSSDGTGLGVRSRCRDDNASVTVASSPVCHGWRGGRPSTASKASATQSPSS